MHRNLPSLVLSSLLLSACGGGGSSGSDAGPAPLPAPTTATVPYLDSIPVPASTYASGSAELGGWTVLQQARMACGFGQLTQNAQLDTAAKLHAQYQTSVSLATGTSLLTHYETVTTDTYYRGYYPWDRTQAQGYGNQVAEILEATSWPYDPANPPARPSLEQRGASSMRNLLNTVYHLSGAMYKGSDIGFGADLQLPKVGSSAPEEYRFGALNGYQTSTLSISAPNGLATYPCDGSSTVPSYFTPAYESPNPIPAMTSDSQRVGPPIYLKVDSDKILTLNTGSIVGPDKLTVPYTTLTYNNDPAKEVAYNEVFIIPSVALQANSSYQVSLTGSIRLASPPHTTLSNFTRNFTLKTGT